MVVGFYAALKLSFRLRNRVYLHHICIPVVLNSTELDSKDTAAA